MPNPATEQADGVLSLWLWSLYGATALGVFVLGLIVYSLVRHRRRNDDLPKQTEGNVPLEVTYTVIPFLIVGLLFAYGMKIQNDGTKLVKQPDVTVDVTAYQWNWRFDYPGQNVSIVGDNRTLPEVVIPEGKRVRFNLIAADVAHSFFVPGFLTKRDVIPGVKNEIEVTPKRTGFYMGHCAEFCGLNHAEMNFRVRVVNPDEYAKWLTDTQQKGKAVTP